MIETIGNLYALVQQVISLVLATEWLIGLIAGFALSEIAEIIRQWRKSKRAKSAILDELNSNRFQIAQKQDILRQGIEALTEHKYLPLSSVPTSSLAFTHQFPIAVTRFSSLEKDNLHHIYATLAHLEAMQERFEQGFLSSLKDGLIADPWEVGKSQLTDICRTYGRTAEIIRDLVDGKPRDIYHRLGRTNPPSKFSH